LFSEFGREVRVKKLTAMLLLLLGTFLLSGTIMSAVPVDERAPDFALPSLAGKNLRLSEYRSEVVVLNFWTIRCGKCRDTIASLESIYQQHKDDGLQVLSVGLENKRYKAVEYVAETGATFPVMTDDRKNSVSRLYEIRTLPLVVVIDRDGIIRHVHSSFDAGSSKQIAAEVAALLAM
jgi:peroxiredoxin